MKFCQKRQSACSIEP